MTLRTSPRQNGHRGRSTAPSTALVVNVIGVGVVGTATAEVLRRLGNHVRVLDADPQRQRELLRQGFAPVVSGEADVTFVCVPERLVADALASAPPDSLWVVRSTIQPGEIEEFEQRFKRHIVHMPEFLRESTALHDAISPHHVVIGECCAEHGDVVAKLFAPLLSPIVRVDSRTSAMVKLVANAHLSTLISFWNQVHVICDGLDVNSTVVGKIVSQDPRISAYGAVMHGRPYGGHCLPKDMRAILDLAERYETPAPLLEAVSAVNEIIAERSA